MFLKDRHEVVVFDKHVEDAYTGMLVMEMLYAEKWQHFSVEEVRKRSMAYALISLQNGDSVILGIAVLIEWESGRLYRLKAMVECSNEHSEHNEHKKKKKT